MKGATRKTIRSTGTTLVPGLPTGGPGRAHAVVDKITSAAKKNFWRAHGHFYLTEAHGFVGRTKTGKLKAEATTRNEVVAAAIDRLPAATKAAYALNQQPDGSNLKTPSNPPNEAFEGNRRPKSIRCSESCCALHNFGGAPPMVNGSGDITLALFQRGNYSLLPNPQHKPERYNGTAALNLQTESIATGEDAWCWTRSMIIGQGGFGTAELWLLADANSREIVDRIVMKRQAISGPDLSDSWRWVNGTQTNEHGFPQRHTPSEAYLQEILTTAGPKEETNIAPLITYMYDEETLDFKLYAEYCKYGSLDSLFPFTAWRKKTPEVIRKSYGKVPEPYVWWILRCLIKACLTLDRGYGVGPTAGQAAVIDWQSILHRDWKPTNILMDSYDNDELLKEYDLRWPRPLVTDFGLAIAMAEPPWHNPRSYEGAGTPGYLAPEQFTHIGNGPLFGSWTNVFGIGMIGYDIIRENQESPIHRVFWEAALKYGNIHYGQHIQLIWGSDGTSIYSQSLKKLLENCTKAKYEERLELNEGLLAIVTAEFRDSMAKDVKKAQSQAYKPFRNFTKTMNSEEKAELNARVMFLYAEARAVGETLDNDVAAVLEDDLYMSDAASDENEGEEVVEQQDEV